MTTNPFIEAARAEAEAVMSEARERVGITVQEQTRYVEGHVAGAEWARTHLAAQEPTDEARIEAASRSWAENGPTPASWYGMSRRAQDRTRGRMRKALEDAGCLSAARAARRDEELR